MTTITTNLYISSEQAGMNSAQDEAKVARLSAIAVVDRREVHVEPDAQGQIGSTRRQEGLRDVEREVCVHALVCRRPRVPSSLASCAAA